MFDTATVAITTVVFILVIADIVGNTLVCAIVKKNRPLRYAKTKNVSYHKCVLRFEHSFGNY